MKAGKARLGHQLYHVVGDIAGKDGGPRAACSYRTALREIVEARDVRDGERCQRQGCRSAWPEGGG